MNAGRQRPTRDPALSLTTTSSAGVPSTAARASAPHAGFLPLLSPVTSGAGPVGRVRRPWELLDMALYLGTEG
jgi:hypothetical protein